MEPNPALESARTAVQSAEQDPTVLEAASVELNRARESLTAAQAIYDESGNDDRERLEHQAYLAERYAAIAESKADEARLEDEIENADAERNEVLLQARRAEAARAEALAAARARQANLARSDASQAEQEAQALQQRLTELEAEQTERGIVLTLGDVLFETARAELQPGAESTLSNLVAFLEEYDNREVLIEGHTDSTGSEEFNQMLSEQRANAVRDELLDEGVPFERIHTRGVGESAPVASNDTAAGRQQNRRVEVIISDEQGQFPPSASRQTAQR